MRSGVWEYTFTSCALHLARFGQSQNLGSYPGPGSWKLRLESPYASEVEIAGGQEAWTGVENATGLIAPVKIEPTSTAEEDVRLGLCLWRDGEQVGVVEPTEFWLYRLAGRIELAAAPETVAAAPAALPKTSAAHADIHRAAALFLAAVLPSSALHRPGSDCPGCDLKPHVMAASVACPTANRNRCLDCGENAGEQASRV